MAKYAEPRRLDPSVKVGDSFSQIVVEDLTRTRLVQYAGASGDYNPIHTDEPFVKEVAGYPTVFAHGMLTMGLAGRLMTSLFGAGNLRKYNVRFTGQVWPGDTLTATARVTAMSGEGDDATAELALQVINQKDETVITGEASGALTA